MASSDFRSILNTKETKTNFTINDINFTSSNIRKYNKYKGLDFNKSTSILEITEFQPALEYDWYTFGVDAVASLANTAAKAAANSNNNVLKFLGSSFEEIANNDLAQTALARSASSVLYARIATNIANDPTQASKIVGKNVLDMYINLIKQELLLHTYNIPYFDEKYITADGAAGWKSNSFKGNVKSELFKHADSIINFPTVPTWDNTDNSEQESLTTKLYLINDTKDAVIKNFNFIKSITSGSLWVQTMSTGLTGFKGPQSIQKSPNLFRVKCKGRFTYLVCSQKIEVKYIGAQRRLNTPILGIPEDAFIPDVYELDITYTSLIPNNFNTHLLRYTESENFAPKFETVISEDNTLYLNAEVKIAKALDTINGDTEATTKLNAKNQADANAAKAANQ